MRAAAFLLLGLVLGSGSAGAQASADVVSIGCEGPFGREASEQSLRERFGDANVATRRIGYEALDRSRAETSLFARPDRHLGEVHVVWHDEFGRRRPSSVAVYGGDWDLDARSQRTGARDWRSAAGIRTGMTLAELEALNGKPFTIEGRDWSYADVTDWNGGRLAAKPGECGTWPTIIFLSAPKYHSRHVGPCPLCRGFSSDDPTISGWTGRVYRFSVSYP